MKFSKLAQYYEKLEATSGRLELVDILSKLFTESDSAEIGKICYLIQGRVAPFFEPVEIGMAEMTIAQAVGRAFNKDKDSVIKLYRQKGNFGLAAAQLAQQAKSNKQKEKLSVSEVFEEILKIAKFSGEGTVEKKVSNLADLLKKLDPTSVKHVVNIPLGTLRLGIGDPTVLDALSMAKCGDKSLRPVLENAYNKTSDLGYVAEAFFKHGGKGIKEIKLVMGKPVRPALAERLPNADEAVKRLGSEFAAEPKFDGFRVAVHKNGDKVELFSRNLEDTTHAFPDIVKKDNKVVKLAEERVLHTANEIKKFFDEAVSAGLEGLMLKKLDSPYVAGGRGFHWIKFKRSQAGELTDTVDCVLLGVYSGRGKRTEFGVGGLLVGVYDKLRDEFVTISRIGTGLTDEEFREVNKIAQHLKLSRKPARVNSKIGPSFWVEPKVVLEVYADEITKSPIHTAGEKDGIGYALRFPRLVKFREADRRPEDATTVSEVEKIA